MNPDARLVTMEDIIEKVILLNIPLTYREGMSENEVLEVACRAWKLYLKKDEIDYAIAVFQNEIKGVFTIISWSKDKIESDRWAFKGEIAPAPIHDKYIGKRINAWKPGQNFPLLYLNL